jgi:hypothetical protein
MRSTKASPAYRTLALSNPLMTTRPKVPASYLAKLAGVNPGTVRKYATMLREMKGESSLLEEEEADVDAE